MYEDALARVDPWQHIVRRARIAQARCCSLKANKG